MSYTISILEICQVDGTIDGGEFITHLTWEEVLEEIQECEDANELAHYDSEYIFKPYRYQVKDEETGKVVFDFR